MQNETVATEKPDADFSAMQSEIAGLETRAAQIGVQITETETDLQAALDKVLSDEKGATKAATDVQARLSALQGTLDKANGILNLKRESLAELGTELKRRESVDSLAGVADAATAHHNDLLRTRFEIDEFLKSHAPKMVDARNAQIELQSQWRELLSDLIPDVMRLNRTHDADKQAALDSVLLELEQSGHETWAIRESGLLGTTGSNPWDGDAAPPMALTFRGAITAAYNDAERERAKTEA
jgi:chromosome segregation ATPase